MIEELFKKGPLNFLLFSSSELDSDGNLVVRGKRADHLQTVLGVGKGSTIRVTELGVGNGTAEIIHVDSHNVVLRPAPIQRDVQSIENSPNIDLVLAMPRPQTFKKVLELAATLAVRTVYFVNAARVEQSYFRSKVLEIDAINELIRLGLEQGGGIRAPEVVVLPKLKPQSSQRSTALDSAADTKAISAGNERVPTEGIGHGRWELNWCGKKWQEIENQVNCRLLLHPEETLQNPNIGSPRIGINEIGGGEAPEELSDPLQPLGQKRVIGEQRAICAAIGPEGGWIPEEVEFFKQRGWQSYSLGKYTVRVETAVCMLLAQVPALFQKPSDIGREKST